MKKTVTIALMFLGFITINAQNKVNVFFNQNFSTFRFVDSEKNISDLNYTIKYGYGLSYQRVFGKHYFVEGLLSYNNKGANSTLDLKKLDWSFHYVNVGSNIGYKFIIGRLSPHFGAGLYYGRLLKADQFIGSDYYNLMILNDIKKNDFGANLLAGLEYEYSDKGTVFFRINESMGLLQLEKGNVVTQKMFNRTFSFQLGLFFSII